MIDKRETINQMDESGSIIFPSNDEKKKIHRNLSKFIEIQKFENLCLTMI